MMYESPITIIQDQMHMQMEDSIYKAVQRFNVDVNKEELIKALAYDRDQYQKGYFDRDQEIVRCKDCKYQVDRGRKYKECDKHFLWAKDDWFCADGERKKSEGEA